MIGVVADAHLISKLSSVTAAYTRGGESIRRSYR